MTRMNQEIGGKQWPGARPAGSPQASGAGGHVEDAGAWLRRNVRACSQQEYRRYREYLDAESASGLESGA
ncbi:hypothetical protein [Castellaniella denitrificans]|jgi:hypothetical protein|uniref:hypothetical protein n=1 Tax=Castellaniella denitrificans TaxID=56119 RepID=UPI00361C91C9